MQEDFEWFGFNQPTSTVTGVDLFINHSRYKKYNQRKTMNEFCKIHRTRALKN